MRRRHKTAVPATKGSRNNGRARLTEERILQACDIPKRRTSKRSPSHRTKAAFVTLPTAPLSPSLSFRLAAMEKSPSLISVTVWRWRDTCHHAHAELMIRLSRGLHNHVVLFTTWFANLPYFLWIQEVCVCARWLTL